MTEEETQKDPRNKLINLWAQKQEIFYQFKKKKIQPVYHRSDDFRRFLVSLQENAGCLDQATPASFQFLYLFPPPFGGT
jgi:hypothetical protein